MKIQESMHEKHSILIYFALGTSIFYTWNLNGHHQVEDYIRRELAMLTGKLMALVKNTSEQIEVLLYMCAAGI